MLELLKDGCRDVWAAVLVEHVVAVSKLILSIQAERTMKGKENDIDSNGNGPKNDVISGRRNDDVSLLVFGQFFTGFY